MEQNDRQALRFADISGMEGLKKTLRLRIIEPFQRPELFTRFRKGAGGGVLLHGPPGCGKTKVDPEAKAVQEIYVQLSLAVADAEGFDRQLAMRLQTDPEAMSTRYLLLAALNARREYQEGLKVAQRMLRGNPQDKELLAIVNEFRLLAQPVSWLFRPLHILEQRGVSRSIVIGVGIVVVLKSALHGYLPSFVALPLLIYLAVASLYLLGLRRRLR